MEQLTDWNAARREAFEEAGVVGRMSKSLVGFYHYDKRMKHGVLIPTRVDVYALEVDELQKFWPERSERKRDWFDAEEAAKRVAEPELKHLISQFNP